jgi:hypothetical protein
MHGRVREKGKPELASETLIQPQGACSDHRKTRPVYRIITYKYQT